MKVRKISKMTSELTAELMMVPNKDHDSIDSDIRFESTFATFRWKFL